ncbi:four-helix bundle copper-binding protein [Actinoplanes subtropicus]|uniref:four-helix bundle copper-binding protein n=1 Tax=Actinoplanes subtropicus TaxID=543632 RepID=UPI0004C2B81B|nr:four-helix bundle copper-binding protein [Actinoplanes subtropicus]
MTTTTAMLETYPRPIGLDHRKLAATIDALAECAQTCTSCADACLGEDMVAELITCVATNLDCADICAAAARVLSRRVGFDPTITDNVLQACIAACRACGDECSRHASMHEHCRICAESCRACLLACEDLLATMS